MLLKNQITQKLPASVCYENIFERFSCYAFANPTQSHCVFAMAMEDLYRLLFSLKTSFAAFAILIVKTQKSVFPRKTRTLTILTEVRSKTFTGLKSALSAKMLDCDFCLSMDSKNQTSDHKERICEQA